MATGDEANDLHGPEDRVAALETAVAEGDAKLAERDAKLAERDAQITKLTEQVAALTEQVAALTELLSRNSKNSHLPPSSDGPGSSGAGKPRGKSGRKRGGQKGHRGSHRELLPPERVDSFIELFPEVCEGCADSLPRVVDAAACAISSSTCATTAPI